jgi:hypothetical protein
VIEAVRSPPGFDTAVAFTVPLPVPPAAESDSHPLLLPLTAADHAHDASLAVTVTLPEPPAAGSVSDGGATVKVHGGAGAASWLTVNVWPATVTVPLRAVRAVFAAAVN